MVYQWKRNQYPVTAQNAGEELERIEAERGAITPKDVIDESRNPQAVLHPCFEWNDERAAEAHREQQARVLIGCVVTVIKGQKRNTEPIRAFVHIDESYKPIERVIQSKVYTETMLESARRELSAFKGKYQTLSQLANVVKSIDEFENSMPPDDAA